ncbi:MAG TPA: tRNA threonylcarbamoyladenosine dehydratase [Candidatus Hydrogenedentes bacterium]|nr:tRNA threonylcarbamoyladenosine dehydratase [Candidatus Hydrogenedentota bacterium]HPG65373.1 tRNA threonylcarbamoyladenosine dehydratase [Candidatus Hydrogenedentota bacterium]
MNKRFSRTALLVGDGGVQRLRAAHVAVLGLGGVGSYALEALARAGVGHFTLVDSDIVSPSNINRQLLALEDTVGCPKVEVAAARIAAIHPEARVEPIQTVVGAANVERLLGGAVGFVVDAIDSLDSKTGVLAWLHGSRLRFVACMGAALRYDPTAVRVGDIRETQVCPLARRVRQALKRLGISDGVRCVYSIERPAEPWSRGAPSESAEDSAGIRAPLGVLSYVPGIIGLTAAGVVINDILGRDLPG